MLSAGMPEKDLAGSSPLECELARAPRDQNNTGSSGGVTNTWPLFTSQPLAYIPAQSPAAAAAEPRQQFNNIQGIIAIERYFFAAIGRERSTNYISFPL